MEEKKEMKEAMQFTWVSDWQYYEAPSYDWELEQCMSEKTKKIAKHYKPRKRFPARKKHQCKRQVMAEYRRRQSKPRKLIITEHGA